MKQGKILVIITIHPIYDQFICEFDSCLWNCSSAENQYGETQFLPTGADCLYPTVDSFCSGLSNQPQIACFQLATKLVQPEKPGSDCSINPFASHRFKIMPSHN